MYELFFRVALRRVPAETAHRAGFALIQAAGRARLTGLLGGGSGRAIRCCGCGRWGWTFPGRWGWRPGSTRTRGRRPRCGALGFGFVEVGTVTAQAQPGNPRPRMFRLPARPGARQPDGLQQRRRAAAAAARLAQAAPRRAGGRGQHRQDQGGDRGRRRRRLRGQRAGRRAAWPTTWWSTSARRTRPGLRDLQAADRLRPVLVAVRSALDARGAGRRVPLLVKIAPDLADGDIDAVADLAVELGLDGIIATNTTIARDGLASPAAEVAAAGAGGLSGAAAAGPRAGRAAAAARRGPATAWC